LPAVYCNHPHILESVTYLGGAKALLQPQLCEVIAQKLRGNPQETRLYSQTWPVLTVAEEEGRNLMSKLVARSHLE
jgi:hypothetical protein